MILKKLKKYQRLFDNWEALASFAKIKIGQNENLNLGQKIVFVNEGIYNVGNENDLSQTFVMEEAVRDGWMNNNEKISTISLISKEVKKFIK